MRLSCFYFNLMREIIKIQSSKKSSNYRSSCICYFNLTRKIHNFKNSTKVCQITEDFRSFNFNLTRKNMKIETSIKIRQNTKPLFIDELKLKLLTIVKIKNWSKIKILKIRRKLKVVKYILNNFQNQKSDKN